MSARTAALRHAKGIGLRAERQQKCYGKAVLLLPHRSPCSTAASSVRSWRASAWRSSLAPLNVCTTSRLQKWGNHAAVKQPHLAMKYANSHASSLPQTEGHHVSAGSRTHRAERSSSICLLVVSHR